MKSDAQERKKRLADCLSYLPRRVLQLHGRDNVAEFVLHELGRKDHFNLRKAAYIVDNPDFDCLKGVAGYYNQEQYNGTNIWDQPDIFSQYMEQSPYNTSVRNFQTHSCRRKGCSDEQTVHEVADTLGFSHPKYYGYDLKHNNHGILLYEREDEDSCDCDYLLQGLCVIGFCPIF